MTWAGWAPSKPLKAWRWERGCCKNQGLAYTMQPCQPHAAHSKGEPENFHNIGGHYSSSLESKKSRVCSILEWLIVFSSNSDLYSHLLFKIIYIFIDIGQNRKLENPCSDLCAGRGDSNASCIPETWGQPGASLWPGSWWWTTSKARGQLVWSGCGFTQCCSQQISLCVSLAHHLAPAREMACPITLTKISSF